MIGWTANDDDDDTGATVPVRLRSPNAVTAFDDHVNSVFQTMKEDWADNNIGPRDAAEGYRSNPRSCKSAGRSLNISPDWGGRSSQLLRWMNPNRTGQNVDNSGQSSCDDEQGDYSEGGALDSGPDMEAGGRLHDEMSSEQQHLCSIIRTCHHQRGLTTVSRLRSLRSGANWICPRDAKHREVYGRGNGWSKV